MFLPSQYWDIVSIMCPWARHLTVKLVPEMAMCAISSMPPKMAAGLYALLGVEMAHK